jgi:RimJ/RimL family protein N-acetyltransferase
MDHPLSNLPSIETERLLLRPLGLFDAEAFRDMTDEPSITDAIDFLTRPFTLLDAEKLLLGKQDGRDCFWGANQRSAPKLIGTVGTHLIASDEIEVGYWFASVARGSGLAAEAVTGVTFALRSIFPRRRIVAECRPQNAASWRLLEKVGFQADGTEGTREGRKRLVFGR